MITIQKTLPKISLAFNPMVFTISSTEQTREDFRYIIEVFDAFGELLAVKKLIGGNDSGDTTDVDISKIIARLQYFKAWRRNLSGAEYIYFDAKFRVGFEVKISEFYDDTTTLGATISDVFAIPAALPRIKFASYNYDDIKGSGKWLTNFEKIRVKSDDKITVSFFCPIGGVSHWKYYFYDHNGNIINTALRLNPMDTIEEDVVHLHAGLAEVRAFSGIPDTATNIAAYEIEPIISASILPPIRVKFSVYESPCKFSGVRMHYLNEWGAVDSFNFDLANRRGVSIEKRKAKLRLDGSQLRPSIYGLGTTPYIVSYTDKLKITSDYLTDNDSAALLELFTSPLVSVETEENLFFPSIEGNKIVLPCDLELKEYDIKKSRVDKLFNLEVEVQISVDNTRQQL
jgi:hypothetical protein